ncbi:hypothetical protein VTN00DRAFT_4899 [Thermoascus crustaceus]|uniref:uncharacterized protein n=1 Tax=Thermoascus crustaceus TaxID=5088 RepID=UPI0037443030
MDLGNDPSSLDSSRLEAQSDDIGQPPSAGAELASAQPQGTAAAQQQRSTYRHSSRIQTRCRFFGSKKGCRAGNACPYLHDASTPELKAASPADLITQSQESGSSNNVCESQTPMQGATGEAGRSSKDPSDPSTNRHAASCPRVVQKPMSKAEKDNPREFQINQLRRRFHPKEQTDESGTLLMFGMEPSDPDFPFDLKELQCNLHVPRSYPSSGKPTLRVTNPEMERGFQINVEKGFDEIVESSLRNNRAGTLLGWMNSLDRQLERFLTGERAQTIKFISNIGGGKKTETKEADTQPVQQTQSLTLDDSGPPQNPPPIAPSTGRIYSAEEKEQADKTRKNETRQLEARLGRVPLFQKLSDGISFIVPVQPSKPERLPAPLRSVKTVKFIVPSLYPLERSSIEVQGVERAEARALEAGFEQWLRESPRLSLMSQINYLVHNMHVLANKLVQETPVPAPELTAPTPPADPRPQQPQTAAVAPVEEGLEDRAHIKVIPRPPEWSVPGTEIDSDTSDEYDSEEDSSADDYNEEGGAPVPEAPATPPGRGVSLSFPSLELYGIELLELKRLSVTLKCERCKDILDVKNVRPANEPGGVAAARVEACKKCTNYLSIGFRRELMHPTSTRAGYLDLEGCTVVDLLPSNFVPTCSECSTPFPAPGVVAVRGESAMATCRECHRRMVFKIPEVKFLVVGAAAFASRRPLPPRKKPKETLGIVAGQELPRRGRCSHYGKSYRWFRFSCCAKVFPCDKCHDAATDHPNEHANRMICGFCSREQIYRPEDCGICHSVLVGKAGSGFWEGGKGTRDKVRMSRKDPRKYKRRGGTTPGSASSSKRR